MCVSKPSPKRQWTQLWRCEPMRGYYFSRVDSGMPQGRSTMNTTYPWYLHEGTLLHIYLTSVVQNLNFKSMTPKDVQHDEAAGTQGERLPLPQTPPCGHQVARTCELNLLGAFRSGIRLRRVYSSNRQNETQFLFFTTCWETLGHHGQKLEPSFR